MLQYLSTFTRRKIEYMEFTDDFFKEEVRLDYRISKEMKQVWGVSLDLAEKLVDVCERNGLKCWIDSGTLLGAVRHQGFIPWDDDIDFVMLRKDYDKLVKIADKEFTYPYFFQTAYSDKTYYKGHAQLRDLRTTSLSMSELDKKYCRGIDVDIFVLDGFMESGFKRFIQRMRSMMIKKTLRSYYSLPEENKSLGRKLLYWLSKGIYKIFDDKKAFARFESMFRAVDEDSTERVSVLSYRYSGSRRMRRRASYNETVWLPFEHTKFPAPADTADCLECYFGKNYMVPMHLPTFHGQKYLDAKLHLRSRLSCLRNIRRSLTSA